MHFHSSSQNVHVAADRHGIWRNLKFHRADYVKNLEPTAKAISKPEKLTSCELQEIPET